MTDIFSSEKRSWIMSRVRERNTSPELMVRSLVHRLGFRFRLHRKELPGKPDLVFPSRKKSFLFMAASGMGMTALEVVAHQKRIQFIGLRKYTGTLREMRNINLSLKH